VHAASSQTASSDDPPDRVARVSYLNGDVSLKPAGTDEWAPPDLNRPLTTDDQLSLERNARAELQAGSSVIQLGGGVAFSFSELSDTVLQARVTDGAIHLSVRRLQKEEVVEIDTPQSAITITKPGEYRIEVLDDGTHTLVKTYSGECQVSGNNESTRLQPHEQIVLDDSGQAVADRKEFTPPDDFDRWAQTRNDQLNRSASSQYVAPDVIGHEELDHYGDWVTAPDYGYVWYPHIAVGWAPYSYGHWAWVSPWGWTWVDSAPWGFAPFHYGRWAYIDSRWGWVPGPIHVHPVYAPALVAWVGGPSFGVSLSFGANVGWFPLAPHEVYVPGYHCSSYHIHSVNYANTVIVNNTIINRAYVNRSTPIEYQHRSMRNAVTVVSHDTFVSARPVNSHIIHDVDMRDWHARGASPAIAPDRASTLGPRWNANQSHMPDRDRRVDREVKTQHAPPPQRTSFEQEQHAIRDNNNRPVPRGDLRANAHTETQNNASRNNDHQNHDRDRGGQYRDGQTHGDRNTGWQDNAGGAHQQGNPQFRDDHPHREFDHSQQDMRPSTQSPSPTPRPDQPHPDQPRPDNRPQDNQHRPDHQQREDQPHGEQHNAPEHTVFHSNDRLPNDRLAGAQQEARVQRGRPDYSASHGDWPRGNSPSSESRDTQRSRGYEHSRPVENDQHRPSEQHPQPQPQYGQQPVQRQQAQNQAPSERHEQPHKGRDDNGKER
jgi:hypothetical protein